MRKLWVIECNQLHLARVITTIGYRKIREKMDLNIGSLLDEARSFFKEKNYPLSLECYKLFFERSSDVKGYGAVRLSYCLSEWVALGKLYPRALEVLSQKKNEALNEFIKTKSWSIFHDFISICEHLECEEEAVDVFYKMHNSDKKSAAKIFPLIYKQLTKRSEWELCKGYMGNGYAEYQRILRGYDFDVEHAKKLEGDFKKDYEKSAEQEVIEDIFLILKMLYKTGCQDELDKADEIIEADFNKRKRPDIYKAIIDKCT